MKTTLMFATMSMIFALPQVSAKTEIEVLRTRCTEQEKKIQSLEKQIQQLRGGAANAAVTPEKKALVVADGKEKLAPAEGVHVVKAGETVERIAQKNRCSVSNLNKVNGLKPDSIIRPGQQLKLPNAAGTKAESPEPPASHSQSTPASSVAGKTHVIKEGETYSSIAKKHRVSVDSLVAANPGVNANALRAGQEIRLSASSPATPAVKPAPAPQSKEAAKSPSKPASSPANRSEAAAKSPSSSRPSPDVASSTSVSAPAKTAEAAPEKSPAATENPPAAIEKKIRSVKIEGPITYGQFAAQHGTDPNRLNDLNGLDLTQATVLAKGSELYVPAQP